MHKNPSSFFSKPAIRDLVFFLFNVCMVLGHLQLSLKREFEYPYWDWRTTKVGRYTLQMVWLTQYIINLTIQIPDPFWLCLLNNHSNVSSFQSTWQNINQIISGIFFWIFLLLYAICIQTIHQYINQSINKEADKGKSTSKTNYGARSVAARFEASVNIHFH